MGILKKSERIKDKRCMRQRFVYRGTGVGFHVGLGYECGPGFRERGRGV